MSSFFILFIIAGVVLAIPFVVAIVDGIAEGIYRVRRHLPTRRRTYAAMYARDAARGRL